MTHKQTKNKTKQLFPPVLTDFQPKVTLQLSPHTYGGYIPRCPVEAETTDSTKLYVYCTYIHTYDKV